MFFIVWRGWGWIIPVTAFVGFMLEVLVPGNWPRPLHVLGGLIIAWGSGYGLWYLGRRLAQDTGRVLVDPATGEQVRLVSKHDLFWVPMQVWGVLIGVLGTALAVLPTK